jgi:hypothetical protein
MRNKKGQFCSEEREMEPSNFVQNGRDVSTPPKQYSPLSGTLNQPPTIKSILMVVVLIWLFNLFSPMVKEELYSKLQSKICSYNNSTISAFDLESSNATRRKEK